MTDKLSPRIKRKLLLVILFLTILSLSYENDIYGPTSLIQYPNEVYFENHLIIKGFYAAKKSNAIEQGENNPIHNEIINVNRNLNTAISTWTSTLDSTSLPTAILADTLIPDSIVYDYSVLTQVEKDRLFLASLGYLAGTEEGYIISELMLYDPNDPGEGFFYELTDRTNMDIGITGFGGFQLWRPISPIEDTSPEKLIFNRAMETVFEEFGGDWHVIFKEVDGEVIFSWHARERIHPASTIKVVIAMLFFEAFDDEMPRNLQEHLAERGTGGRTYEQLLRAMLVVSEEDATEILVEWIEERLRIRDSLERWGLTDTTINPRRTTAEETARILEGLYQGMWIEPRARDFILELMSEYTSSDDGRLGVIREQLPNCNIYNKRGSLAREWVIVADTAIIECGEKAYIVSLFAYPNDVGDTTYEDLEAAIEEATHLIGDYITANSLTASDLSWLSAVTE